MKTVLVTGGSRGIGKAVVEKLTGKYNVAFTYFESKIQAENIVDNLKNKGAVCAFKCDVRNKNSVNETLKAVKLRFSKIDFLVNCAGIAEDKLFTEITTEEWENMLAVNLNGTFFWCQAVLPEMISRQTGAIVNIASIWGETGASMETHYSVSKAAVIGLTKSLAKEVAPSFIRVNAVSPGAIDTDMMKIYNQDEINSFTEEIPLGRIGRAEEVASAVEFLLENEYITGEILRINGGYLI